MVTAPSNVEIALHRIHRLFLKKHGNLFLPSFVGYASSFAPDVDIRKVARERVQKMYAAYVAWKDPPPFTGAAVSFAIDCHVKLLLSDVRSLHLACRQQLVPEFVHTFPASLSESLGVTVNLWSANGPYSNLRRLLRKGGPFPSSVRYVSSQLARCLADKMSQKTVATLLRMNMVGAYAHTKVIAPIATRMKVYAARDCDLIKVFEGLQPRCSHDYFYSVAEYVLGCAKMQPSIWTWVSLHSNFVRFEKVVVRATDIMRTGHRPPRVVNIVAPRAWTAPSSANGLMQACSLRKKINAKFIELQTPKRLHEIYKAAILQPQSLSYVFDVASVLGDKVAGLKDCTTDVEQRRFCASLPETLRAELQAYCHGIKTRNAITFGPLSVDVATAQKFAVKKRTGFDDLPVCVCICCGTWRPKTINQRANRGTVGVRVSAAVDKPWTFTCNFCKHSWGIRQVNMVGTQISARFAIDGPSLPIVVCVACGYPSASCKYVGTLPFCSACAANRVLEDCFRCGRQNKGDFITFCAQKNSGGAHVFSACPRHAVTMAGMSTVPVEMVRPAKSVYSKKVKL